MTGWCALVPQKSLSRAKARLELPRQQRRAIATAMLRDTVTAVRVTVDIQRVLVLWDDEADSAVLPGVDSLVTRGQGLNRSLEVGAAAARSHHPGCGVVVVPGDLPALDPRELAICLERASRHCRAYLADEVGTGTTILTATPDVPLLPAYGAGSAAHHAATGAHSLDPDDLDSLRADVDDLESLARAMARGRGNHTRSACAARGLALVVTAGGIHP